MYILSFALLLNIFWCIEGANSLASSGVIFEHIRGQSQAGCNSNRRSTLRPSDLESQDEKHSEPDEAAVYRDMSEEALLKFIFSDPPNIVKNGDHFIACGELTRRAKLGAIDETTAIKGLEEHLDRIEGRSQRFADIRYEFTLRDIDQVVCDLKGFRSALSKQVLERAYYVALSHQRFRAFASVGNYQNVGWERYLEGLASLGKMPRDATVAAIKHMYIDSTPREFWLSVEKLKDPFKYLLQQRQYLLAAELLERARVNKGNEEEITCLDQSIQKLDSLMKSG